MSLRTPLRLLGILVLVVNVTSCSSLPIPGHAGPVATPCARLDWYEIGRLDGLGGSPAKMEAHRKNCQGSIIESNFEMYANGREAGLVSFCSPAGGLEAGKSGISYEGVCPQHIEPGFLSNYRLGRKIYELEVQNTELEARIDNLVRLITPMSQSNSLRTQIEQLRNRRTANNLQISDLENRVGAGDSDQL